MTLRSPDATKDLGVARTVIVLSQGSTAEYYTLCFRISTLSLGSLHHTAYKSKVPRKCITFPSPISFPLLPSFFSLLLNLSNDILYDVEQEFHHVRYTARFSIHPLFPKGYKYPSNWLPLSARLPKTG